MSELKEYFSDHQNCLRDLEIVRQKWGSTTTTFEEWEQLTKGLGFMMLYCPEALSVSVESHLFELTQRISMVRQGNDSERL